MNPLVHNVVDEVEPLTMGGLDNANSIHLHHTDAYRGLSHDRANSRDPYTRGHVLIHFRWIIPCFSLACLGGFAV
jgi:hypothetical protein